MEKSLHHNFVHFFYGMVFILKYLTKFTAACHKSSQDPDQTAHPQELYDQDLWADCQRLFVNQLVFKTLNI